MITKYELSIWTKCITHFLSLTIYKSSLCIMIYGKTYKANMPIKRIICSTNFWERNRTWCCRLVASRWRTPWFGRPSSGLTRWPWPHPPPPSRAPPGHRSWWSLRPPHYGGSPSWCSGWCWSWLSGRSCRSRFVWRWIPLWCCCRKVPRLSRRCQT